MAETLAILKKKIALTTSSSSSSSSAKAALAKVNLNSLAWNIDESNSNVDLVTWGGGTDDQITAMVNGYYAGTVTLADIQSVWKIGDTRKVSLSAMDATGVGEFHAAQDVYFTIVGFNVDELTIADGEITKALVTVQQSDVLNEAGYMNATDTNVGGWEDSARRSWCNDVYTAALPSYLKNLVKSVNKTTTVSSVAAEQTSDKAWLLSSADEYDSYYSSQGLLIKNVGWWLRTPSTNDAKSFANIGTDGGSSTTLASSNLGLAPAFCI